MEYNIFNIIRTKINIPYFLRVFFGFLLIFISLFLILLPILPGSLVPWVFILIIGSLLIVPWEKIRHVVKIRKWIFYLAWNLHKKKIIKHKIKDIKDHIKNIIREKRKKKIENKQ